jgi:mRNA interferase MazF
VVLSPSRYNARVGLAIVCPITNQSKGYPFEVALPPGLAMTGVILADHVRSVDWQARTAEFICSLPQATVDDVLAKLYTLL